MMLASTHMDQAMGLRQMKRPKPVRVIAVTSGKGGVGKTTVSVNLAISMANRNQRVMLMDADLGLANVDVLLGLHPTANLSHVISGECALEDILLDGPGGIQIVPAASGTQKMAELSERENAGVIRAFSDLSHRVDTLIIDTAAGIAHSVVSYCKAAQEVLVVVCDEPTSITDAYALIKVMSREHGIRRFHIVANMTHSSQEGRELFGKLSKVSNRFLDVTLDFMGVLPYDPQVKKAVQRQRAVVDAYPRSKASTAFKNLAQKADKWPRPTKAAGHLEFFVERLIQATQNNVEASL